MVESNFEPGVNTGAATAAEQLQAEIDGLTYARHSAEAKGQKETVKEIDDSIARRVSLLADLGPAAEGETAEQAVVEPEAEQAVAKKPTRRRSS